jgi:aryl-alcohol dehydrogenase-like predicted oxidoreductase
MQYRTLGKTNLRVSVVGIGTWQYGGEWGMEFKQPTVDAIFDKGRELGVNLIDTAECYGDHTSEAFVGNAIQRDRDQWIVATKFGHVFHGPFNRTDERSARDVRAQVTKSLAALKTDFIDLLQYHSVRDSEFMDEAVRDELAKLVAEGKVRFIGNSIGSAAITAEGHNVQAALSDKFNVSALQVIYNRLDRRPEEGGAGSVFTTARNQNLGILARVPLASGLLSGKYKPGAVFPDGDVRAKWKDPNLDAKLEEVQQIARTEVPPGVDMAAWALAWCLKNPVVTSVIPGCKNAGQLEQNARASELNLRPGSGPAPTAATQSLF